MQSKNVLGIVVALVIGIALGYVFHGSNIKIQDQGAVATTAKLSTYDTSKSTATTTTTAIATSLPFFSMLSTETQSLLKKFESGVSLTLDQWKTVASSFKSYAGTLPAPDPNLPEGICWDMWYGCIQGCPVSDWQNCTSGCRAAYNGCMKSVTVY